MKKNMKFLIAGACVLVAAGVAFSQFYTPSANAEDASATKPATATTPDVAAIDSAWSMRCNAEEDVKAQDKRGKCEIYQRQDVKESGQRVIEFAIGYPVEQKEARGIFILPMGILLQSGVKLAVDDQAPMNFQVRYCLPNGCYAFVSLNEEVLATLSKGTNASVEVVSADGKPLKIAMPLKGFSKALKQVQG